MLKKEGNVTGYSFYSMIDELEQVGGCFMNDLSIEEEFRGCRLGAALRREVISDCSKIFNAKFMQWL